MNQVFEHLLSTPEMLDVLNAQDFVAAMLQFEAALSLPRPTWG